MLENGETIAEKENDSSKLDVAINEYYQFILNEYDNERDRKQSIETRSGIVLTIISAFFVFAIEKISLCYIFGLFSLPLTFTLLLKILFGIVFYLTFFVSVLFSLLSIKTKSYAFYNVSKITTATLLSPRVPALGQFILDFVEIIQINRNINEKKAKYFNWSVTSIVVCIACLCIHINII